jgi:ribonuclease J
MKFKIHRGTKEIGGSCVEVWTEKTRILIDCGMPLVATGGGEFDMDKFKDMGEAELIEQGVLPNVLGLYDGKGIDAVVLSHAHLDHYGLFNFVSPDIDIYLGEATHKIIELSGIFTPQLVIVAKPVYFEREKSFKIGDITITPYWADHSAFDSYSFLIEADGKKLFYSGDFRGHGRKSKVFDWFTHHAP